jgi:hypothetical protein
MKPNTSSPGMGLQQLANVYMMRSLLSPKMMSSASFLGLILLGSWNSGFSSFTGLIGFGGIPVYRHVP